MDAITIVIAVAALIVLGVILFTYFYSPDWFVDDTPPPKDQPEPSAKLTTDPFTSIDGIFKLRRPVKN